MLKLVAATLHKGEGQYLCLYSNLAEGRRLFVLSSIKGTALGWRLHPEVQGFRNHKNLINAVRNITSLGEDVRQQKSFPYYQPEQITKPHVQNGKWASLTLTSCTLPINERRAKPNDSPCHSHCAWRKHVGKQLSSSGCTQIFSAIVWFKSLHKIK